MFLLYTVWRSIDGRCALKHQIFDFQIRTVSLIERELRGQDMPVLIVDNDINLLNRSANAIASLDRRMRVETAQDAHEAWEKAIKKQPFLVICEPFLPERSGVELCQKLGTRLSGTTFVAAYQSHATKRIAQLQNDSSGVFQGFARKPLSTIDLLSFLTVAKRRRGPECRSEPQIGIMDEPRQQPIDLAASISIHVTIDDELKFCVPVPKAATVGLALRTLGKIVTCFTLYRNGEEIEASLNTVLFPSDLLTLKR